MRDPNPHWWVHRVAVQTVLRNTGDTFVLTHCGMRFPTRTEPAPLSSGLVGDPLCRCCFGYPEAVAGSRSTGLDPR